MNKTKFKDTELGSIPTDWDVLPIDSLIISMNDGPFGTKLKQEHYTLNREARIIQLSNIGENGWNDSNAKYTTFEYSKELPNHIVNPGDVIVAKMMPAGRAIICPNHEARFVQGSDAIKIKFDDSIDTRYFIYGTKGNGYLHLIEENTQGSTRQRIAITKYRKFPFIVPPKVEQLKIAKALSDTDALIKELDVLIEKKRAILQGTMQELLTAHRRLSGFSEPWKEIPLAEYTTITMGQSPDSIYYNIIGDGLPLIQGNADIKNFQSIIRYYSSIYTKVCEPGDIIMSVRAPVGAVGIASFKSCLGRGVCSFSKDKFLFFVLRFREKNWEELSAGSTFDSVNTSQISNFKINIPNSIEEKDAIAEILSDMDSEISELEAKRDKYIAIRQGMMQQLLTGKIRLI